MKEPKHCDDYINDYYAPMCLRWFLFVNRLPAADRILCEQNGVDPTLFADHNGKRCRINVASRLGDVGYTYDLKKEIGYHGRAAVEEFSNFSSSPSPPKRSPERICEPCGKVIEPESDKNFCSMACAIQVPD